MQDEITNLYKKLQKNRCFDFMSDSGILNLDAPNFNSYKSRINADLRQVFGVYALKRIGISSLGSRPNTRYGILVDRNRIEVVY